MVTNWRQGARPPMLPDHVALTGALGGIGQTTMGALRDQGVQVTALDISEPDIAAKEHDLNGITYRRCDITSAADRQALLAQWSDEQLPQTLICLAGVVHSGTLLEQADGDIRRVFDVNLFANIALMQEIGRRWIAAQQPGHIIAVSSWVQDVPWPGIGPYSASKAALRSIARTFAREYASTGIRCNVVAPGIVGVGMALQQWDHEPDYRARAERAIPLGQLQSPQSVADAVTFLCSSWATYMTGSTLLVDGGASLYPMDGAES